MIAGRMLWNVAASDRECLAAIGVLNARYGLGNYSQLDLAAFLECGQSQVSAIIARLRHDGKLITEYPGGRSRMRYHIVVEQIPDKWKTVYPTLWESNRQEASS
jgi:hypothetical protein